ncbi:MAG: hypothetical protein Unbinned706contig1001_23 [Prokaryotic dsDNA virus sp.]|nr:MAG: hypothetical protein Unbinned706contig1001_23 [Prokaryotic dsDNA virus sp.]|tara:strand:- start:20492 stop:21004 length:513 start_codon:yes stop_codon:yes gene_type:complete
MSCILGNGISLGCKDSLGGIKEAYIASFNGNEVYTIGGDDIITGISGTENFFTFEQRNEQGEFTQTGNHSVENGTNFWEQVVSLIFTKNDSEDRNTLKVLAQSALLVIVKDQNDTYWVVGKENGADLTASSQSAGKAYGDLNGTTISITGKEQYPAYIIDQAGFDALPVS